MKKILFLIVFTFLLAACGPSEASVQRAIALTQTAAPTVTPLPTVTTTPTPIPLKDIDLSASLIADGDLPAGYSGAQIRLEAPEMFSNVKNFQQEVYQQFEHGGDGAGGVTIFLFDDVAQRDVAYDIVLDGFADANDAETFNVKIGDLNDLGEKAKYNTMHVNMLNIISDTVDIAFVRCHALVHIRMSDTIDIVPVQAYAERLDGRLSTLVCP
jgi:hypothetical protein